MMSIKNRISKETAEKLKSYRKKKELLNKVKLLTLNDNHRISRSKMIKAAKIVGGQRTLFSGDKNG